MAVNTKSVAGRRALRFETLDDVLAEVDRLEGKPLKVLGNWSVGQILAHLAIPMNGAIDGVKFPVPWYFRAVARLLKKRFLRQAAPAGFQLPKAAAETLVPPPTGDADGFAAIRRGIHRLKTETHREPSPLLGPLTVDEWNQLNCRHCELHLSFIVPEA